MMSDDGPSGSSPSGGTFKAGDLIWAKMRGSPHWPAKVLEQGQDTPAGRIPIVFFGTKETAFMKPSDCSDYLTNRQTHEIPRKLRGFNDGVHEIRVEAGIEAQSYRDPKFFDVEPETSSGRIRRASYRLDSLMPNRKRSPSGGSRSRASSTQHSTLKLLHKHLRKRLDSESSNGSKRRQMISGGLAGLAHDSSGLLDLGLEDGHHWGDTDSLFGINDDARSSRSKRSRGVSKIFEDALGLEGSPHRGRTRAPSQNEGRRSRLISGVSDFLFDDLFTMNNVDLQAMAADFLNTVDDLPSDSSEIFPSIMEGGTPERPAPLPRPAEFCTKCGSECKLEGKRWRCSSKFCNEWMGFVHEAGPSTSSGNKAHPSNLDIQPAHKSQPEVLEEEEDEEEESTPRPKKEGTVTTNQILTKEKPRKKAKLKLKPKKEIKEEVDGVKEKKKVQITSPRQYSLSPPSSPAVKEAEPKEPVEPSPVKDKKQRPNKYNVIKTPPVSKNGLRHCTFCNGQVRPQMCGGNKHRWRCVDKKCRKWYGWVRSNDEIPVDLGRKGRHSSVLGKIKLKRKDKTGRTRKLTEKTDISISSCGEAALAAAALDTASLKSHDTGRASPARNPVMTLAEMRRKKLQAAQSLMKMKGSSPKVVLKKKPSKKREMSEVKEEDDTPRPREFARRRKMSLSAPSPLTAREMKYRPCAMEKRSRWWMSEKRRGDPSPERELQTELADAAAAFRCISHAFRSAAVTRADEPGTVNGSLDLMMDSLLGCMGPLLSLLAKLPNTKPEDDTVQKLWNSSAVHMPIFQ